MNDCDRYPLLARLPHRERAAWVAQAECGEPLSADQADALGLPLLAGAVLTPRDGDLSASVRELIFDPVHVSAVMRQAQRDTQGAC